MREKTGKKLKLPFVLSRPISRNQFCRLCGWSHNYVYLYRTRRRTARIARPANARTNTDGRTDTQKHGRRCTDADAESQTQKHGCRLTDADADARTQMQAPDGARTLNIRACSAWVEKSSRRVLRLNERTRTFEVYYIYVPNT